MDPVCGCVVARHHMTAREPLLCCSAHFCCPDCGRNLYGFMMWFGSSIPLIRCMMRIASSGLVYLHERCISASESLMGAVIFRLRGLWKTAVRSCRPCELLPGDCCARSMALITDRRADMGSRWMAQGPLTLSLTQSLTSTS